MIDTETVFILGSGASQPYGLPTDADLLTLINDRFISDYRSMPYTSDLPHRLIEFEKAKRTEHAEKFINRLRDVVGTTTIDEFISLNSKYEDIGKKAIQHYLLEAEIDYFDNRRTEYTSDWFEIVLRETFKECKEQRDPSLCDLNNVHFLTFNYDRIIEHLFIKQFISLFQDLMDVDINKKQIEFFIYKVIHLYGSLGYLPPKAESDNPKFVEFGETIWSFERLTKTLDNIRLIKDGFINYDRIKKKLYCAKRIFFLGIGFIEKNIKMLQLKNNLNFNNPPQIYGTVYGKKEKEINKIIDLYFNFDKEIPKPIIEPIKCKELIENYF